MFGTPERFGAMVREGYPMVWHPGAVRFRTSTERDGRTLQRVLVTDRRRAASCSSTRWCPATAGWRIDGVRVLQEGATGA